MRRSVWALECPSAPSLEGRDAIPLPEQRPVAMATANSHHSNGPLWDFLDRRQQFALPPDNESEFYFCVDDPEGFFFLPGRCRIKGLFLRAAVFNNTFRKDSVPA
ncbi:hypothetical protein AVEN_267316-1 [Araneus ventricosus]|uniref:Uncharacterized protein n=1 Tax=Araneus ventricosus TaxID=182803 RepID=A0A4Y2DJI0_ARAVE|nr:hypothetical protein AVEN_267316-1 [Araneus ventricosus]